MSVNTVEDTRSCTARTGQDLVPSFLRVPHESGLAAIWPNPRCSNTGTRSRWVASDVPY